MNLPGGKTCMHCRKSLFVSMRLRKGGKATSLKIVLEMLFKKVSVSTSKFRFILPNLHKMNWQDLVTLLHSKSLENSVFHAPLRKPIFSRFHQFQRFTKCQNSYVQPQPLIISFERMAHPFPTILLLFYFKDKGFDFIIMKFMEIILFVGQEISIDQR